MVKNKNAKPLGVDEILDLIAVTGDYAIQISNLRRALRLSQSAFAKFIDVSHPAISAWEMRKYRPSAEAFIKLGNLAPYPLSLWFWREAGVSVEQILLSFQQFLAGTEDQVSEIAADFAAHMLHMTPAEVRRLIETGEMRGRVAATKGRHRKFYVVEYDSVVEQIGKQLAREKEREAKE